MALIEFKNKPDTETPINAPNLNYNFKELLNLIYPIGAIMIKTDNIDYSDYLGFEWERTLVGKTPVGIDSDDTDFNAIGKTGGEKLHILTVNEMPANNIETTNGGSAADGYIFRGGYNSNGTFNFGGQTHPHNNLQPYEVVAFWKRVA